MPVTSLGGEGGVCARLCVYVSERRRELGEKASNQNEKSLLSFFLFFFFYPEDQMTFAFFLPEFALVEKYEANTCE